MAGCPGFPWLLFILMYSEVFIWTSQCIYAKFYWRRKWSVSGFGWPWTGPPLVSIGWPACLPPRWPDAEAKWARCRLRQQWPSASHVSAASLWQAGVRSVLLPPFPQLFSLSVPSVCMVIVWIKKGGGRMDLSLRYRNKKDIIDCRVRVLVTAIHGSAVHPSLLETPVYSHRCDTSSSLLPFSFNTTHIDVTRHFNLHTFSPEGQLWHNTFSPINQTYFLSYI